ncbi:MAG TPA: TMEM175 family protein [Mycobacteriales bacterium]|nr:TMEM175 family protein [Mycobacteriales bacterium]
MTSASTAGEVPAARSGDAADTDRLEAFSDGVFAIAITLLVLELHVPHVARGRLWHGLVDEWPQFAAYLSSFFVIGIMWVNHHSMFKQIRRIDRSMLFLNLLLLLWTALLPFPTGLIARHLGDGGTDAKVAEAVYGANLTLAAIAFSLIWTYAVRHRRLIDHDMSPQQEWASIARFSVGTFVYAATIGIAFVSPGAALALQFLLALYYLFEQLR